MNNQFAISSWSGGKDSCLACYKAIKSGINVKYLLNFISREYKRCCFHGLEAKILRMQSELAGIQLVQKETSPDMKKYEEEFKSAVQELKSKGINQMIFGDVYLNEHREWVERVCSELNSQAIEPLWNVPPEKVVEEFIESGFKAIVVSAKADLFGRDFVGRYVDSNFLEELKQRKICPCGENGEFHTLVVEGPIFKGKIEVIETEKVLKKGFWEYWFLDIKKVTCTVSGACHRS